MNQKHAKRYALLAAAILLLFVSRPAQAFDGRQEESLVIAENELLTEDLYFNGSSLVVNGTIQGDLFFAGGSLEINGTVDGDLYAGGNLIQINGMVTDDVLAGGSAVIISEGVTIAGDALVGGFGVSLAEGATVVGDMLVGAQSVLIDGDIGQTLSGGGAGFEISGSIGKDVNIEFGPAEDGLPFDISRMNPNLPDNTPVVAPGLILRESASIGGDFNYNSTQTVDIPEQLIEGDITFTQNAIFTEPSIGSQFLQGVSQGLQRWVVIILLGGLGLRLAPGLIVRPAERFKSNIKQGLWSGLLSYLLWLPAILFSFGLLILVGSLFGLIRLNAIGAFVITLGALLVAVDVVLILMMLAFVAYIWVGQLVGQHLISNQERPLLPLALGTFIIVILSQLPFVGGPVRLVVGIIGFGMIWTWFNSWHTYKSLRSDKKFGLE